MKKLPKELKKISLFVLEDDLEVMTSALNSDLDGENKRLNRLAIKTYTTTIKRIEAGKKMRKRDLLNMHEAAHIHANNGNKNVVKLQEWIKSLYVPASLMGMIE